MRHDQFELLFDYIVSTIKDILIHKGKEYAPSTDRLENFKIAAALAESSPIMALRGMLAKHVVSVWDYVKRTENGEVFTLEQWKEKIFDYLNYGVLLYALIVEADQEREQCQTSDHTNLKT